MKNLLKNTSWLLRLMNELNLYEEYVYHVGKQELNFDPAKLYSDLADADVEAAADPELIAIGRPPKQFPCPPEICPHSFGVVDVMFPPNGQCISFVPCVLTPNELLPPPPLWLPGTEEIRHGSRPHFTMELEGDLCFASARKDQPQTIDLFMAQYEEEHGIA